MGGILTPKNQTSTKSSQVNLPPEIQQAYSSALGTAQGAASTPYTPYSGNTVAPFSDLQNQAFAGIPGAVGAANPYINQAAALTNQSTQGVTPTPYSAQALGQYMNPYTQDVVNATQGQFNLQNAQQQAALTGNAASQGALGGDRSAVAAAQLAGQQQTAQAPVIAGLENQNFQQATGEFNTQQQTGLAAQEANAYTGLYGAGELGNLGELAQGTQLQGLGAELNAGAQQQAQTQAQLNVPYQNYLTAQQYPFYTSNFLTGSTTGLGSIYGGNTSSTSTTPGSSLLGSLVGAGVAGQGLGLYGQTANNAGTLQNNSLGSFLGQYFADGGEIPAFQAGGDDDADFDDPDEQYENAVATGDTALPPGYTPNAMTIPQQALAAAARPAPQPQAAPTGLMASPNAPQAAPPALAMTGAPTSPGYGLSPQSQTAIGNVMQQRINGQMPQAAQPQNPYPAQQADPIAAANEEAKNAGLTAAGLGIMASKGRPLDMIGQGGLEGVKAYQQEKQEQRQMLAMEGQLGYRQAMSQAATTRANALAGHYENADSKATLDNSGDTIKIFHPSDGSIIDTGAPTAAGQRARTAADAAANGAFTWQAGTQNDPSTGQPVTGMWKLPTRGTGQPQFIPGDQITGKGGSNGGGATGQLADQLVKEGAVPNLAAGLALLKDPSGAHAATINAATERLAQAAAKADPDFQDDSTATMNKWRAYYGTGASSAKPAPVAAPAAANAPPKVVSPPRPQTVPAGALYSPSRKQWKDTTGKMYNAAGLPL